MALPATDNFNRADENPLAGNWTTVTNENALSIVSNQVNGSVDSAHNGAYWNADVFNADQFSEVICVDVPFPATSGPIVRVSNSARTYYYVKRYSTTVVRIGKFVAGTETQLGADISATCAAGDKLRLTVIGTTLTATLNDVDLETRTDSSIASGSAGIKSNDLTSCTIDTWQGGNVAAGGGGSASLTPTIGSAALTGIAPRNDRGIFVPTEIDV